MLTVILIIIGIAVYLNIGWFLGAYYHENIVGMSFNDLTIFGKIFAGPKAIMVEKRRGEKLIDEVVLSIGWSLWIIIIMVAWIIYGFYWFLWFIFAGGIIKLICPKLTDTKFS